MKRVGQAARLASLVTAALLLLLLSRSEIRKTLLARPVVTPALAFGVWLVVFLASWWRTRNLA